MDIPLIYTAHGNLPVESLEYETKWETTSDYVKFIEIYKKDGEVVRESAHVLALKSLEAQVFSGQIGG